MTVKIRANPGLRLVAGIMIAFMLLINTVIIPGAPTRTQAALYGIMFGVLAIPAWLGATACIKADADRVTLVNMWTVRAVPMNTIRWISVDNGFEVVLNSGSRESSTAIAQSLIGAIGKYPSARRARRRIEEVLGRSFSDPGEWRADTATVQTKIRTVAICTGLFYAIAAGMLTLLISISIHS